MTRADVDRTGFVRAWLAAGSEELSPRVLENVLREFPAMNQDRPHWAAAWPQFSSFAAGAAVGAAMAVTLAVAMVGAGLFGGDQRGGPGVTGTPTPAARTPIPRGTPGPSPTPDTIDRSYRDVGFIGLAPRGATPSDPTRTELVEVFWRPGPPYNGAAFLYADGRLIWNEYFPAAASGSTGWLEQSLTDEGIELLQALSLQTNSEGPRLLKPEELPGLLPDGAWVERAVRPYVPSGYAACLFVTEQENPFIESDMTLPEMLAALPPAAEDLLRDRPFVRSDAYGGDSSGGVTDCLGLDGADARRLDAALRAAGYEQQEWRNRYLLQDYAVLDRLEAGTWWLEVWFEPILPDGTITCSSCG
jgi:hypothetical protein